MNFRAFKGTSQVASKLLLAVLLATGVHGLKASGFRVESVGARGGGSLFSHHALFAAEGFVDFNLPWRWEIGGGWTLQTKADFAIGWLGDGYVNAAVGSLGPAFLFAPPNLPLSFETGCSPTLLSQHHFDGKDLGGPFQFTTHLGVNWDVARPWRFGYRFEHMSNARIYGSNPGANIHMLSLSRVF